MRSHKSYLAYISEKVSKPLKIDAPRVVREKQFYQSSLTETQCVYAMKSTSMPSRDLMIVRNMKRFAHGRQPNLNPAGGGAHGDSQDRLPFMGQRKARIEGQVQRLLSENCHSRHNINIQSKLVFDNGPEMRGKLTSSPATLGPSIEKVTFRQPLRGYFHA